MSSIATSKSGVIDRMRVTAVTAITPCVGGLVIWYPDDNRIERQASERPEQPDSGDTETEGRQKSRQ